MQKVEAYFAHPSSYLSIWSRCEHRLKMVTAFRMEASLNEYSRPEILRGCIVKWTETKIRSRQALMAAATTRRKEGEAAMVVMKYEEEVGM